jgi:hypothetical protein
MIAIVVDKRIINIVMKAMFENSGMLVEGCGVVEDSGVLVGVGVSVFEVEGIAVTESAVSV